MNQSIDKKCFSVGCRDSNLSRRQTSRVLAQIQDILPDVQFNPVPFSSPGDRDRKKDLRESPADFFSRDLDAAVLDGTIDCAVHSAKDLPYPVAEGLDWFWLPWREDPRDCIVLAPGKSVSDLGETPVIGVSSDRRELYCQTRFPTAELKPLRGNIEDRIAQLDAGKFDMILMAGAALNRLDLHDRITKWIPLTDLPVPEGQGVLAMTFKAGNTAIQRIRSLCVPSVVFAGSGAGDASLCTAAASTALKRCHTCLYDSLVDPELLTHMPDRSRKVYVGKRRGEHSHPQEDISTLICDHARKGRRVVRLKGGDPGVFGRLVEEAGILESHGLAFRVIPGISSLLSATTTTGMLLTRRGTSNGFTVMTSRKQGGGTADVTSEARKQLPLVLFMSVSVTREVTGQLISDGLEPDTPAAIVFNAGSHNEYILRGTAADLADKIDDTMMKSPGLLIIGSVAAHEFQKTNGALQNRCILLTCSRALQEKTAQLVYDFGGIPLQYPLIDLVPSEEGSDAIRNIGNYDWVILTSPSSVRCFSDHIKKTNIDIRKVPHLLVCGSGTAAELKKLGLHPDAMPETDYSTEGILACSKIVIKKGMKVLRLRSQKAGAAITTQLRERGITVDDAILYHNEQINYDKLPEYDTIFFASGSAVDSFVTQWGTNPLKSTTLTVIGTATKKALQKHGIEPDILSPEPTVEAAMYALACYYVNKEL